MCAFPEDSTYRTTLQCDEMSIYIYISTTGLKTHICDSLHSTQMLCGNGERASSMYVFLTGDTLRCDRSRTVVRQARLSLLQILKVVSAAARNPIEVWENVTNHLWDRQHRLPSIMGPSQSLPLAQADRDRECRGCEGLCKDAEADACMVRTGTRYDHIRSALSTTSPAGVANDPEIRVAAIDDAQRHLPASPCLLRHSPQSPQCHIPIDHCLWVPLLHPARPGQSRMLQSASHT